MARHLSTPDTSRDLFRDIRRKGDPLPGVETGLAGVDEAGRGPIAGPVVSAAVILDPERVPEGLDDSKALSAQRRDELFALICARADVAVAIACVDRIAVTDIRAATLWSMTRAVGALATPPETILVDGRDVLPGRETASIAVIGGDARHPAIAAASIIAKVTRDRIMCRADDAFPGYGFASHKGYGTAAHLANLRRLGPCPLHRVTFAPVARLLRQPPRD